MGPDQVLPPSCEIALCPMARWQVLAQVADQGAVVQFDVGPFVEPQLRVGADVDCRPPSPSTVSRGEGVVQPNHVSVVPRSHAVGTG